MSQLSYEVNFDKAFEGLLGDVNNIDSVSRITEGAGILFGRGVQSGTDEEQIVAAATGQIVTGKHALRS